MTMHVGLIGAGNISGTHARAARAIPDVEVVAVCDVIRERAERLSAEFAAVAYDDLNAFLDRRPMEMVIVGSPSGLHAQQGIAAAQHGLNVLVEKPIDITTDRADGLIAACDAAGVMLGVIFQERFHPANRRLKQLISDGGLGKILLVEARVNWYRPREYYSESRWHGVRAIDGGGALMNQGVHTVDLLLWLFGDVVKAQARTAKLLHEIECEDTAVAILEFASGALGTLQVTTAAYPGYERRLEITGSEGTVILEGERIIAADLRGKHEELIRTEPGGTAERASSSTVSDIRGHQSAIEDFIRAIRDDGTPACDGREARRSLALIEQIYQAAENI
jgi:UDP-N-acetyl-2-amino-2-deoxyglucuronate dehydrogenase